MEGLTPEIPILLLKAKGIIYTANFHSSAVEQEYIVFVQESLRRFVKK